MVNNNNNKINSLYRYAIESNGVGGRRELTNPQSPINTILLVWKITIEARAPKLLSNSFWNITKSKWNILLLLLFKKLSWLY